MKTKILSSLLILSIISFSGCAKRPENIKAIDLSNTNYLHYTCADIDSNLDMQKNRLKKLEIKQNSKADIDAWLLVLSILPVSTITGEYEKEISDAKGKIETFRALKNKKNCQ
ncbi:hypothetical protein [Sulfurospirillum arcachonense]|uniref:hypothetical protein n=1 Tax=Sulfurospirillum arcachonense TaxID=57666 RepID=UPI00046A091E|nr:hypothetical protein [Sulfurospirillum arcachonense]